MAFLSITDPKCVPGPMSWLGSGEVRGPSKYFDAYVGDG